MRTHRNKTEHIQSYFKQSLTQWTKFYAAKELSSAKIHTTMININEDFQFTRERGKERERVRKSSYWKQQNKRFVIERCGEKETNIDEHRGAIQIQM